MATTFTEFKAMKVILILSFLFLSNCSYLGLSNDINEVTTDSKIETLRMEEKDLHPFPILQGLTTSTQTEIKILAKSKDVIEIEVYDQDQKIKTVKKEIIKAGDTEYVIHVLNIYNLKKNTTYALQVFQDKKIIDQRNFQTVDLDAKKARIGVVSCMQDKYTNLQYKMWNEYLNHTPTYTFMIGDNVYADSLVSFSGNTINFKFATVPVLWKRYIETFNTLSYYRTARLIPTLAIWDDHDYGFKDGNETYPHKKESLKVFESFFGSNSMKSKNSKETLVVEPLEGAGYVFHAFNQQFVFIDGRSFRSAPNTKGTEAETHLGKIQTQKILKALHSGTPTWLIKGDQFFGGYSIFESFELNHPKDFKNFLAELKKQNSKVFFVSGDRHLNELMKIDSSELGYETYELTSSAIHASVYKNAWKKYPNPRQISGVSGVRNYSIVETEFFDANPTAKKTVPSKKSGIWTLDVVSYGPENKELYKKELIITD